eukprot:403331270
MGGDKKRDRKRSRSSRDASKSSRDRKRDRDSRSRERSRRDASNKKSSRSRDRKEESNSKRRSRFDLGTTQSSTSGFSINHQQPLDLNLHFNASAQPMTVSQQLQLNQTLSNSSGISTGRISSGISGLKLNNSASMAIQQFKNNQQNCTNLGLGLSINLGNGVTIGGGGSASISSNPSYQASQIGTDIHSRRLYVGGVPTSQSDVQVVQFLTQTLRKAGGILEEGDPVIKSQNNPEKRYTFLELRSVEEASTMIQLDGIKFMDSTLRIRRPEDYDKYPQIPPRRPIPQIDTAALGIISTKVEETPLKIFVGGLPKEFNEEQIKNLLLRYGQLKSFHLVKHTNIDQSRGFAFCEYTDEKGVQNAIQFLNGLKIGSRSINVRRTGASTSTVQQNQISEEDKKKFEDKLDDFINETGKFMQNANMYNIDKQSVQQHNPFDELERHNQQMASYIQQSYGYTTISTVMEIKIPALSQQILDNDQEHDELVKDLTQELQKFGKIRTLLLPRSLDMMQTSTVKPSAIGKAFVEFEEVTSGFACYNLLNGRQFMGMPVEINFYNKDLFVTKSLM